MKVNIVLNPANRSWILEKFADNLARDLTRPGVGASITEKVDETADIVHHMSWAFANVRTRQPSTMFITHLDDPYKLRQVRATLSDYVQVGICMSSDTVRQLLSHGCNEGSLVYISPAHDGKIQPRRTVIGITTRIYPDGRKGEALLRTVASQMDLSGFEFRIFGQGWDPIVPALAAAGADVRYFGESSDFRQDYVSIQAAIPHFDYYLYLGMDEGSLGTLDALAAGIGTIVTPQGFHLDLPGGITHPVVTAADLQRVLTEIDAGRRSRIASVMGLTWERYADRHLELWDAIFSGRSLPSLHEANHSIADGVPEAVERRRRRQRLAKAFSLRRFISAVSHWPGLRAARRAIDHFRFGR